MSSFLISNHIGGSQYDEFVDYKQLKFKLCFLCECLIQHPKFANKEIRDS
jgi:hypothetical protein